jgi:hypothetical protein
VADKTTESTTTGTVLASDCASWANVLASFVAYGKAHGVTVTAVLPSGGDRARASPIHGSWDRQVRRQPAPQNRENALTFAAESSLAWRTKNAAIFASRTASWADRVGNPTVGVTRRRALFVGKSSRARPFVVQTSLALASSFDDTEDDSNYGLGKFDLHLGLLGAQNRPKLVDHVSLRNASSSTLVILLPSRAAYLSTHGLDTLPCDKIPPGPDVIRHVDA